MTNRFPKGWNQDRVKRVLEHYEQLSEEEQVAEDEAAFEDAGQTFVEIPTELLDEVRDLIAKRAS